MQKIILAFCLVFIAARSSALARPFASISGTVRDENGKPISDVSVLFSDARLGTATNARGEFTVVGISSGAHLIELSHIGFGTVARQVIVSGDMKLDFIMISAITENDAVILTGVSRATQMKKNPFRIEVMRREELQQSAATNIIDAITRKAGVAAIGTGAAISKPVIRGLGYNRVLTLNDGVRQEGQQWGDEHGIEIDEASVNKVEILKGPASLIYGSDAMAGVVNIITNVPAPLNTIRANIGSNYQTNNHLRSLNANVSGNVYGLNWNAYGTIRAAGDYKNKYDGYVFNSKFKEHNAGGYVGYNAGWGFTHLLVSSFNLQPGLIEGERDSAGNFVKLSPNGESVPAAGSDFSRTTASVPFQHIRHTKMAIDNSFGIGNGQLTANIGYQRNRREEFGNPADLAQRPLFFDLQTITYAVQLHLAETKGWKPSIGINGFLQKNKNRGVEQLIPDYRQNDAGGFVFLQKEKGKLNLSGGARYDIRNLYTEDLKNENGEAKSAGLVKQFSSFSGSAGATYAVSEAVNLKLNIARAFRAPSVPELVSNGAHEGTIRYEYGRRDLKSETSTQLDASVEMSSKHISLNLAGYVNGFKNFIFYRRLSSASAAGGDSVLTVNGEVFDAFTFDQQKATLAGFEMTLDIHPHPADWLHIQNSFSYVAGTLREAVEGVDYLPSIPAPRLLTEFRGNIARAGKNFGNGYIKIEVDNNFAQRRAFTAFNTETATAFYTLINAGFGADILDRNGKTALTVNFAGNNLADRAYQSHLSRLKYAAENFATGRQGVFNTGRNFSLKLNVPIRKEIRKKEAKLN